MRGRAGGYLMSRFQLPSYPGLDNPTGLGVVRFVLGPISQWGISKGPWAMDKKHLPTTDHPVRVQATLT